MISGGQEGAQADLWAEGVACPKPPTLQGGPCPSRGAAKAVRIFLRLDVSGIWVSLPVLSRKQSCVEEGAEQHPGSRSSVSSCKACSPSVRSRRKQVILAKNIPEADCDSSENKNVCFAREGSWQEHQTWMPKSQASSLPLQVVKNSCWVMGRRRGAVIIETTARLERSCAHGEVSAKASHCCLTPVSRLHPSPRCVLLRLQSSVGGDRPAQPICYLSIQHSLLGQAVFIVTKPEYY